MIHSKLIQILEEGALSTADINARLKRKAGKSLALPTLENELSSDRFRRLPDGRWCLVEDLPEELPPLPEETDISVFHLSEMGMGPFAVVDVETTGQNENARVVQVAAVFFEKGQPVRALNRYIHPGEQTFEPGVISLLGMDRDPQLRALFEQAPPLEQVLPDLQDLNGLPWVAHNATFDRVHLEAIGLTTPWHFDTLELAGLAFPQASSLKEGEIAAELGLFPADIEYAEPLQAAIKAIDGPQMYGNYHNALTDVLMLSWIYLRLIDRLPEPLKLALGGDWSQLNGFLDNASAKASRLSQTDRVPEQTALELLHHYHRSRGREPRAPQDQMLNLIANGLQAQQSLAIEAPTGTGKTLAYLFPALEQAWSQDQQVAICTYTKNLQDQLAQELETLCESGLFHFDYAVLKGQGNYLCLEKLKASTKQNLTQAEQFAALYWWAFAFQTTDGLLESGPPMYLAYRYPQMLKWKQALAADSDCGIQSHPHCWKGAMGARVAGAQVLVMNHALWFSRQKEFPDISAVVIDEAHELESAATAHGTREISGPRLARLLTAFFQPQQGSGLLAGHSGAAKQRAQIRILLSQELPNFARLLLGTVKKLRLEQGAMLNLEIPPFPFRVYGSRWHILQQALTQLIRTTETLIQGLQNLDLEVAGQELCLDLVKALDILKQGFEPGIRNRVHLLSITETEPEGWRLEVKPVDVSRLLQDAFVGRTVVLTSATLDLDDKMAYTLDRIGLGQIISRTQRFILPPVLPYASQAALAIARAMVYAPTAQTQLSYASELAQVWRQLLSLSQGRALLLFTARNQMVGTIQELRQSTLPFPLLVQNEEPSRLLLHRFRNEIHSVLAGLRSYWQGVDVSGEALSLVCMAKLPFAVYKDPLVAARSRLVERQGKNAFEHYLLPEMLLAFKQGFGRLLRSSTDQGAVIVFDRRLAWKSYLPRLLRVLPGYLPRNPQAELGWQSLVEDLRCKIPGLFEAPPETGWLERAMPTLPIEPAILPLPPELLEPRIEQGLKAFGFESFRGPEQEAIARKQLAQQSVLGILPTGGGKSLTFQLAAMLGEGLTLVISPLVALIQDQIENLASRGFEWAGGLFSGQAGSERQDLLERTRRGVVRLLYVAPERLRDPLMQQMLKQVKIRALVVDEAHCIYSWGPHFRPDFLYLQELFELTGPVPVTALTATAPPHRRKEILKHLGLPADTTQIIAPFHRPELRYRVYGPWSSHNPIKGPKSRLALLLKIVMAARQEDASVIVYVNTTRMADQIASQLSLSGFESRSYHGGMNPAHRMEVQDLFIEDHIRYIVCTKAFGMGIDKPGIRYVVHYDTPGDLVAYAQESGRAGRSMTLGQEAWCILMYSPKDENIHRYFAENQLPDETELQIVLNDLRLESQGRPVVYYELERACLRLGDQGAQEWEETRLRVLLHRMQDMGWLSRGTDVLLEGQVWRWEGVLPATPLLASLPEGPPDEDQITDFQAWATELGYDLPELGRLLAEAVSAGQIGLRVWRRAHQLTLSDQVLAGAALHFPKAWLEKIRQEAFQGWQEMQAWTENTSVCRVQTLMQAMGEPRTLAPCGNCDVCAPKLETPWSSISDQEVPQPYQYSEAPGLLLEVLSWNTQRVAAGQGKGPLGLKKLLAMLVANDYYLDKYGSLEQMMRQPFYGVFRTWPNREKGLESLLKRMGEAGYCVWQEVAGSGNFGGYLSVSLTEKGLECIQTGKFVELPEEHEVDAR